MSPHLLLLTFSYCYNSNLNLGRFVCWLLGKASPKETRVCSSFFFPLDTSFSSYNIITQIEETQTSLYAKNKRHILLNSELVKFLSHRPKVLRFRLCFHWSLTPDPETSGKLPDPFASTLEDTLGVEVYRSSFESIVLLHWKATSK